MIDDGQDEAPIVGLALLPPMDTLVLPPGSVDSDTRDAWEQQRLVMSLADTCSGYLCVAAGDDKRGELHGALIAAGIEPLRSEGPCCWLSVVGEGMAVRRGHVSWASRLAQEGIAVLAAEVAGRRVTYVLPEAARSRAVTIVHGMVAGH